MPIPSFLITGTLQDLLGNTAAGEIVGNGLGGATPATVTFTPNVPAGYFVTFGGVAYRVDEVVATVGSDGTITRNGDPVLLLANDTGLSVSDLQWQVHASGMKRFWFNAPNDGDTINLGSVAPVPGVSVVGLPSLDVHSITGAAAIVESILTAPDAATIISDLGLGGGQDTYLGTSANQSAMLAKTGPVGSWTIRTDTTPNTVWYLTGSPASSLGSWTELPVVGSTDNADGTATTNGIRTYTSLPTAAAVITANTAPAIGKTTYYNASGGNLTPAMPALSGLSVGARLAVRRDPADTSANTITFTLPGGDTFYSSGSTTFTLPITGEQREYQVVQPGGSGSKYWAPAGPLNPVSGLDARYLGKARAAGSLGGSGGPLFARNMPGPLAEQLSPLLPTITWGSGFATTISGGITLADAATDLGTKFTLCGASGWMQSPADSSSYFPNWRFPAAGVSGAVGYESAPVPDGYAIQFNHDGRWLEIAFRSAAIDPSYTLIVDGKPCTAQPVPLLSTGTTGATVTHVLKFDFGARAQRKIRLEINKLMLRTIFSEPNSTITPAPPIGPRLMVIGDSYAEGAATLGGAIGSFVFRLGRWLGCEDVWNGGKGQSGWVSTSAVTPSQACTFAGDTITVGTAHGLFGSEHSPVVFTQVDSATGLVAGQVYYITTAPTTTTLKIATTPGGSAITFAGSGSGFMLGGYSYTARTLTDVIPANPDIVIYFSFYNDRNKNADGITTTGTAATVAANVAARATQAFQWLSTKMTNRPQVYVIGGISPTGAAIADPDLSIEASLKTVCASFGIPYYSPQTGQIFDGAGTLLATDAPWVTTANKSSTVVFDTATHSVTFPAEHGLTVGDYMGFASTTGSPGITVATQYFVYSVASPTVLQVATVRQGGSAVAVTDGTGVASWHINQPTFDQIHLTTPAHRLAVRRLHAFFQRIWNG